MSRNFVCAECGGKLELGIIVDLADNSLPMDASYWMEGSNEKSKSGLLNVKGKKKHYISALRCVTCGLLKFYAGPDNSGSK
jgi:hypothetical protein